MCDHKCPLCGKDTVGDEIFCRDCQEIAENSYPPHFLDSSRGSTLDADEQIPKEIIEEDIEKEKHLDEEIEEKEEIEQRVEGKKNTVLIAVIVSFLVILIALGAYIYVEGKKATDTEVAFWTDCVEANTPAAYADYLNRYPNGMYIQDAELHIRGLRKTEEEEWTRLKNSNNLDKYAAFLIDHPNSPYTSAIRQAMDSLSWATASSENTADAYKVYLENIQLGTITGEYQSQAQEKYDYLSTLKTLEGKELTDVRNIVSRFYQSLSSMKDKEFKKVLDSRLSVFYTMENISSDSISIVLKKQMKENKIKNVSFIPQIDSLTAIVDNKNSIFVTLPVLRQITYSDRKKEAINQHINIEMNEKYIISKIDIKD